MPPAPIEPTPIVERPPAPGLIEPTKVGPGPVDTVAEAPIAPELPSEPEPNGT